MEVSGILPFHMVAVETTIFLSVDGTSFVHTNHRSKPAVIVAILGDFCTPTNLFVGDHFWRSWSLTS